MDGVGPAAELRVTWALGATSRLDSAVDAPCASESVQFQLSVLSAGRAHDSDWDDTDHRRGASQRTDLQFNKLCVVLTSELNDKYFNCSFDGQAKSF